MRIPSHEFYNHKYYVSASVTSGTFNPLPVKRVYIPKDNGEKSPPEISAIVLNEHYEDKFPYSSFWFRPERVCHNATDRVLEIADEG